MLTLPHAPQPLHLLLQLSHEAEEIIQLVASDTSAASIALQCQGQARAPTAAENLSASTLLRDLPLGLLILLGSSLPLTRARDLSVRPRIFAPWGAATAKQQALALWRAALLGGDCSALPRCRERWLRPGRVTSSLPGAPGGGWGGGEMVT